MSADKRQRPTSYLVIPMGDAEKQIIVWDTVDISVGRNTSQDIVVADPEVSREHAVFRRRGEACEVQDLNTGLGTSVDGRAIKVHALQHGNVIQIGTLEIEFGQSAQPIPRAKNVRFASELKEFGFSALEDGAGRTMLGFDTEDDLLQAARARSASASSPRAVTAEGTLEIDAADSETFDLGADDVQVRNLDLDLAADFPALDESAVAKELAITAPTEPKFEPHAAKAGKPAARLDPLTTNAIDSAPRIDSAPKGGAKTLNTAKMVLEIKGPADQVEAFLRAIRDKRIQLPPLELLVRDI